MAISFSSCSSHLRPGAFHMFYKYTTDITYITEIERKKNNHGLGLALSIRKEKFCPVSGNLCSCGYHELVPKRNSLTATRRGHPLALADLDCGSTSPNSSLQLPPPSDRRLFLAVANPLRLTDLRPCLSSSSFSLVGNLVRRPLCEFRAKTDKGIL